MRGKCHLGMWLWILFMLWGVLAFAQQDFQEWLKKEEKSFQAFKDERDKAFCEFLKSEWRKMQIMQGIPVDEAPKPVEIPAAPAAPIVEPPPIAPLILPPPPVVEKKPKTPPPLPSLPAGRPIRFTFFDHPVALSVDAGFSRLDVEVQPSGPSIADFWQRCSQTHYEPLLKQLTDLRQNLVLNDWGFFRLTRDMAQHLWPTAPNRARLLVWFLLCKSGYDSRVGYDSADIYLLLNTASILYSRPYFEHNEKKYYLCNQDLPDKAVKTVYTYDSVYPGADQPLDLHLKESPLLGTASTEVKLTLPDPDSTFVVRIQINPSLIAFYRDYPQTDLSVYFKSPMPQSILVQLANALMPRLVRRSMPGALNLLLHFVQFAFTYKTDEQQFGREKPLFPEETLYYPASDCEDRSVLFAHLAQQFLGVDVVGLDYPGHVATAVRVQEKEQPQGDYVMVRGERYLVCDPTFMNARIGQSMPRFKNVTPDLIQL